MSVDDVRLMYVKSSQITKSLPTKVDKEQAGIITIHVAHQVVFVRVDHDVVWTCPENVIFPVYYGLVVSRPTKNRYLNRPPVLARFCQLCHGI